MTVSVPTDIEFSTLSARVNSLESSTQEFVTVQGFTDPDVANAWAEVLSNAQGGLATKGLYFPPGNYSLSNPLIPADVNNHEILHGLVIRGAGRRVTNITYSGSVPFISAYRRLRFFRLEGMTVKSGADYSQSSNVSFCYAYTDTTGGFNQRWTWDRVEFSGRWNYVLGLDGPSNANLNSEMVFNEVETDTTFYADKAFLTCGGVADGIYDNQEHQFLNYTFTNCNLTGVGGTFLEFNKGGSITVVGGSWSGVKPASGPFTGGAPITWFSMPLSASNNRSVTQLAVHRVRFEPKRDDHVVIDCRWGSGSVGFYDCSAIGGAQNSGSYGWKLYRFTGADWWGGSNMPAVCLDRLQTVGGVEVTLPALTRKSGSLVARQSYFYRGNSNEEAPARASGGTYPVLYSVGGVPRYRFQDCDNVDDTSGGGTAS